MSKSLIFSVSDWDKLKTHIEVDHGKTVFMIRDKTRRALGLTVRHHEAYILHNPPVAGRSPGYYQEQVHLDFTDDMFKTMFLLKYGGE